MMSVTFVVLLVAATGAGVLCLAARLKATGTGLVATGFAFGIGIQARQLAIADHFPHTPELIEAVRVDLFVLGALAVVLGLVVGAQFKRELSERSKR